MFITTQNNSSALDPKQRFMTWPGPRILLTGPDALPRRDWIASAEVRYLVIDLAARPASRFDALRIAITRLIRARVELGGALLYTHDGLPEHEVERLERAARQDPWLIESATDPVDGHFSMLVLGDKIVTNPLFKSYFNNLHEGITEMQTGGCIALIEEHLVWRRKRQSR